MSSIKCGTCKNTHETVDEVRACSASETPRVEATPEEIEALMSSVPERKDKVIEWTSKEVVVMLVNWRKPTVAKTGNLSLQLELVIKDSSRKIFQFETLTGGTLDQIDRMVCKFTMSLLSDVLNELPLRVYVDALEAMVNIPMRAWVYQDSNGRLCAPITLRQGRSGWKPLTGAEKDETTPEGWEIAAWADATLAEINGTELVETETE